MRPGEVLDARNDLLERTTGTPKFALVIDALGEFEFGRSGGYQQNHSTALSQMLTRALPVADVYRVSHDMSLMVQHVAGQLDDTDTFHHEMAPSTAGFVALDRPLPLVDVRGKTMLLHYLVWGPIDAMVEHEDGKGRRLATPRREAAVLTVGFNDVWRQPDDVQGWTLAQLAEQLGPEVAEQQALVMGRWATVGASAYFDGQRLGPMTTLPSPLAQAKILEEGDTPHEGTNAMRYIHALWLLMSQTVAHVADEEVDRTARRRAQKKRLPPKVTVVKLRKEKDSVQREGETAVEWAHRFIVKGHLRWQPYGVRNVDHDHVLGGVEIDGHGKPVRHCVHAGCDHRVERILIHPYMKNAHRPDLPLLQTEKVYSLER